MTYLFSPEGLDALNRFCRDGTLVAIDYDGTLAAITSVPAQAHIQPTTRSLLARVARRYPVVVLTGRSRHDAQRLLGEIHGVEIIGNHGAETAHGLPHDLRHQVAGWSAILRNCLPVIEGVVVEDKEYSLSIHFRLAANPVTAEAAVRKAAAELAGARLIGGKYVVNIVSDMAPDKGDALLVEQARIAASRALFIGDDVTDEAVFRLDRPEILSIRVGKDDESLAAYYLQDRDEVDALLRHLLRTPD